MSVFNVYEIFIKLKFNKYFAQNYRINLKSDIDINNQYYEDAVYLCDIKAYYITEFNNLNSFILHSNCEPMMFNNGKLNHNKINCKYIKEFNSISELEKYLIKINNIL